MARLRRPVVVLHTAAPGPGGAEVASRYGAGAGASLPGGVDAHPAGPAGEVVYWLPAHAALVAGGALARDGRGGLRVGPGAEPGLRGLAGLPIERVLTARGEPVLGGGRDVVLRALAGTLA